VLYISYILQALKTNNSFRLSGLTSNISCNYRAVIKKDIIMAIKEFALPIIVDEMPDLYFLELERDHQNVLMYVLNLSVPKYNCR
jgi:hypothetical protein